MKSTIYMLLPTLVLATACDGRNSANDEEFNKPFVASYVRLYADETGDSHFEDLESHLMETEFAPPAGPLYVSQFASASGSYWVGAYPNWDGEEPHPTPRKQVFVTVRGEYEVTASDGETRRFPVGSVLVLEDTHGAGHTTRMTGDEPTLVFGVDKID